MSLGFDALSAQPLSSLPAAAGGASFTLAVDKADLSLVGQAITFNGSLGVTKGDLAETGQAVAFRQTLTVGNGTLTLTGQDVTLDYAASYTLTVDAATLTLSAQAVTFNASLGANKADLTLSGAGVAFAQTLSVGNGTLTLSGQDLTLIADASYTLPVDAATLTLVGQDIGLSASGVETARRGGGVSRYPRRVFADGRRYTVKNRAEEAALLEMLRQEAADAAALANALGAPELAQVITRKATRLAKRKAPLTPRIKALLEEDEIILALFSVPDIQRLKDEDEEILTLLLAA